MATITATRTAGSLTDNEMRLSALRRLEALEARYGADSPQVEAAVARWEKLERIRSANDDLAAIKARIEDDLSALVEVVR